MESLLMSDTESIESDYETNKHKFTKKSKFAEIADKENDGLDEYDKSFALRTELIYNHFNSNRGIETELTEEPNLLTEQDINQPNEIFDSSVQRKELENKIKNFHSKKHDSLSKSFLRKQAQLFIDFEKGEDNDDLLNYELIVHGYIKGVFQRVYFFLFLIFSLFLKIENKMNCLL
jgi:hypothetical protein